MKFQRKRSLARLLGTYLESTVPYLPDDTVVVNIPTATKRIRQRGFDQAALIAQTFAKTRKLAYSPLLRRAGQAELIGKRRVERLKTMQNSIQIAPKASLTGKNILLVDDVLTTGATLEAAAGALRQAGAKHVDAAIVARRLLT